jgi:hypothetical protein
MPMINEIVSLLPFTSQETLNALNIKVTDQIVTGTDKINNIKNEVDSINIIGFFAT